MICVPTSITQVEKRAVIDAAQQAGTHNVRLIEEPIAAAIGAKLPIHEPFDNLIIDIGGGTTEVAVISLSTIAYSESVRVAGDTMNMAIQRYFQDEFQLLIGENMAERVKIVIGSACPLAESVTMKVPDRNLASGSPKALRITGEHVCESLAEPVRAIIRTVRKALDKTRRSLQVIF